MQKPVLVIKLGTAVITNSEGVICQDIIKKVAAEVAALSDKHRIVLVSSGAVGAGKHFIRNYKGGITERKAAAAIGNPLLIQLYQKDFSKELKESFRIPHDDQPLGEARLRAMTRKQ